MSDDGDKAGVGRMLLNSTEYRACFIGRDGTAHPIGIATNFATFSGPSGRIEPGVGVYYRTEEANGATLLLLLTWEEAEAFATEMLAASKRIGVESKRVHDGREPGQPPIG